MSMNTVLVLTEESFVGGLSVFKTSFHDIYPSHPKQYFTRFFEALSDNASKMYRIQSPEDCLKTIQPREMSVNPS